jgi:aryl-alcohol dehydrogenase-like predicted oxidoreductase
MENRPLGPGGPDVTVVGFGGMPLSIARRPEAADAVRVLHASLDAGVTLIDTADVYCLDDSDVGHNERLIARALREWSGDADGIVVATKGGLTRPGASWASDARPEQLRSACEASLTALGVDAIDLYQLHRHDPEVPFADSVGELARLRAEGKIRRVGLSNVSVAQIQEAGEIVPIVSVQNRLSPFFREAIESGVVRYTAEQGIGFLAYSPVGGGRLNLKLPDHPVVAGIARSRGVSPHAVVLAWVLGRAPNVIVIPGARTVSHALDAVSCARIDLTHDEDRAIEAAEFSIA